MLELSRDIRYAGRALAKKPAWTAVILLTLATGVGANTIMFALVNPLVLRPVPFKDPDRLVAVMAKNSSKGYPSWSVSIYDFQQFRNQSKLLEDLAAIRFPGPVLLTGQGLAPQQVTNAEGTSNFLSILGIRPLLGRWFSSEEERLPNAPVAVISYALWQRAFAGDENVIGRSVIYGGFEHTIVGVLPRDFRYRWDLDVWTPVPEPEAMTGEDAHVRVLSLVGRLNPRTSVGLLQAELDTITDHLAEEDPANNKGWGALAAPLQQFYLGQRNIGQRMLLIFAVVGLVLLICCANIVNLTLARGSTRQKEIAIRAALGASRGRLIWQLMTESLMLSITGGLAGLLLASGGVPIARTLLPANMGTFSGAPIKIDLQVFAFTLTVSLATGLLFGLAPALQFSRTDLNEILKQSARSSGATQAGNKTRNVLVTLEFAISIIVVIGAGLGWRSFSNLERTDPGFNPDNVLIIHTLFFSPTYNNEGDISRFYNRLNDRLKALPGVRSTGLSINLPLEGRWPATSVIPEGGPAETSGERPDALFTTAAADYFQTLGIGLVAGRFFDEHDMEPGAPQVAIVSRRLAERLWPGQNPIGRRVATSAGVDTPWQTVVGVVPDVHHSALAANPDLEIYWPTYAGVWEGRDLIVKTSGDPMSLAPAIQRQIHALDSNQPYNQPQTMAQRFSVSLAAERLSELLFGIFAGIALLLAALGIYGTLSYSVSQRSQEIGIRMALGATGKDVFGMVVREGLIAAASGMAAGIAVSIALSRVMSSMLYHVSATDPVTFLAVPALMTAVAVAACYLPARTATRTDPMATLRSE